MKVSCICPTYNRVVVGKHLLEETVQSFLAQTYEDKELIIINDHEKQEIVFDHPQVKVLNLCFRFCTLGQKYNAAVEASTGELICTWEDDDISLPNRLEYSVRKLGNLEYFNPLGYWFLDGRGLHHEHSIGVAHNCSIFRRSAFDAVGGYSDQSGPQDAVMNGKLAGRKHLFERTPPKEWTFIYRWGVSNLHLSAFSNSQQVYEDYAKKAPVGGRFKLDPHWREDYLHMTQQYLEKHQLKK